ncbi:hypothetical protein QOZ80_2AG0110050 [Eleusine coracana subsp. coracana]|nr:hypothetical protein QOZ80_2AG0110050 [Eleusine coracana subsp. coracana]
MAAPSSQLGHHRYLPYPQASCREIEHHLHALAAAFPSSFDATLSPFTHDDGRDAVLVNATAALPVGAGNNAEVSVWLVEAYPRAPPLVFMSLPSLETAARPAYVDASGVVTAPYLQHWAWPESDLVGLLDSLQVLATLHYSTTEPRGYHHHAAEVSAHDDLCVASVARHRSQDDDVQTELRALQENKDRLEKELKRVTFNVNLLEKELKRKLSTGNEIDGVAEPCCEASGSDNAAEESMDALDRELQAGRLPLCQYLKATKDVARAQFLDWPVPPDLVSLARPKQYYCASQCTNPY